MILSSEGYGDKLSFTFPGEAKRVPKGRALAPAGPKIRPTAVQPIFATASLKEQGRQNSEIQNIITGIVKLLNGNVNVQANTQLLNGRPGRPMASRINNRGPPKISDVPPIPELDPIITPPAYAFHPTKTPPPYPFDRPPYHGVNLPEQIVPPVSPHRPGFHRPMPPWQRPRPRPPNRRPNPNLPIYKPTPPPPPIDIPNYDEPRPGEEGVSENEASHSENNISDNKEQHQLPNSPEVDKDEIQLTTADTTTPSTTTTTTTTTTESTTTTTESTTTTTTTTTTEKPTEPPTEKQTEPPTEQPTQPPTEKIPTTTEKRETLIDKKEKKKHSEKEKQNKDINRVVEGRPRYEISKNDTSAGQVLEPSMSESSSTTTTSAPTPTEGLISHAPSDTPTLISTIKTSSINSQPLPSSQGIPYHPYRPRPGIVLDDPALQATRYPVQA
ncbi:unnamed protein product, partial [Iphiclides podalirius]